MIKTNKSSKLKQSLSDRLARPADRLTLKSSRFFRCLASPQLLLRRRPPTMKNMRLGQWLSAVRLAGFPARKVVAWANSRPGPHFRRNRRRWRDQDISTARWSPPVLWQGSKSVILDRVGSKQGPWILRRTSRRQKKSFNNGKVWSSLRILQTRLRNWARMSDALFAKDRLRPRVDSRSRQWQAVPNPALQTIASIDRSRIRLRSEIIQSRRSQRMWLKLKRRRLDLTSNTTEILLWKRLLSANLNNRSFPPPAIRSLRSSLVYWQQVMLLVAQKWRR